MSTGNKILGYSLLAVAIILLILAIIFLVQNFGAILSALIFIISIALLALCAYILYRSYRSLTTSPKTNSMGYGEGLETL